MSLGSLVWDTSATMIDFPLENSINMHSVWTAWFQFWGKHLLHIDVLFFRSILNVQHRIKWVQLDRLKKVCAKRPDRHLKFECSVLHSNVDYYFKFEYNFFFFTVVHWIGAFSAEFWIRIKLPSCLFAFKYFNGKTWVAVVKYLSFP